MQLDMEIWSQKEVNSPHLCSTSSLLQARCYIISYKQSTPESTTKLSLVQLYCGLCRKKNEAGGRPPKRASCPPHQKLKGKKVQPMKK